LKLHGGQRKISKSIKSKLVLPGDSLTKQMRNNWKMWGDRGLVSSHLAFEMGIAVIIVPLQFVNSHPSDEDKRELAADGCIELFRHRARQIAELGMYDAFCDIGWTPRLAKQVRRELIPRIINAVTLTWYAAAQEASATSGKRKK